jgi:hypothetical protein
VSTLWGVESCGSITAGSDFTVGDGGDVAFTAGEGIVLQNGFSIQTGGAFTAALDAGLGYSAFVQDDSPTSEVSFNAQLFLNLGRLFVLALAGEFQPRRFACRSQESETKGPHSRGSRDTGLDWVELYGYTVKEIAGGLEKYVETASRLVSRAATRMVEDQGFREHVQRIDSLISQSGEI